MPEKTDGQLAYEAYAAQPDTVTATAWENLSDKAKAAWEAAGAAVRNLDRPPHH